MIGRVMDNQIIKYTLPPRCLFADTSANVEGNGGQQNRYDDNNKGPVSDKAALGLQHRLVHIDVKRLILRRSKRLQEE
ncbi:unnamed protein product [Litomosoides sigmodontis]|uniref:Uncharacterized protein n=1 Tax=Litomosoides sigmodontis TaxID=42156 RepID=A0A3P6SVT2_LITSI|nr:unnamed protein product [Litomosoides sigmodontis]